MSSALDVQVGGSHYKSMPIQPVEFSTRNGLTFLEGCVVKRVSRHSRGGKGREDIEKAIHELELLRDLVYGTAPCDSRAMYPLGKWILWDVRAEGAERGPVLPAGLRVEKARLRDGKVIGGENITHWGDTGWPDAEIEAYVLEKA